MRGLGAEPDADRHGGTGLSEAAPMDRPNTGPRVRDGDRSSLVAKLARRARDLRSTQACVDAKARLEQRVRSDHNGETRIYEGLVDLQAHLRRCVVGRDPCK